MQRPPRPEPPPPPRSPALLNQSRPRRLWKGVQKKKALPPSETSFWASAAFFRSFPAFFRCFRIAKGFTPHCLQWHRLFVCRVFGARLMEKATHRGGL